MSFVVKRHLVDPDGRGPRRCTRGIRCREGCHFRGPTLRTCAALATGSRTTPGVGSVSASETGWVATGWLATNGRPAQQRRQVLSGCAAVLMDQTAEDVDAFDPADSR